MYSNLGSSLLPQFDNGSLYFSPVFNFLSADNIMSDIDADGDLDFIYSSNDFNARNSELKYAINSGSNINPVFEISAISPELVQCNNSLVEIDGTISSIALVDIDGDNDLDLFSHFKLGGTKDINVYCENQGSKTNPLFSSGVIDPFGLSTEGISPQENIFFGDIDGDGDQDAWIDSTFYDNVGTAHNPLFRQISDSSFYSISSFFSLVDMDGDGQIDSTIDTQKGLQLLFNNLNPASHIAAISLNETFVLASNRSSQVQLQICRFNKGCINNILLPVSAQELSLNTGDFNNDGEKDIVLAMIDAEGLLKIKIFNHTVNNELELIGSGVGGPAETVSVSTGQLDDDPADEYVVSLVQADGHVAAISFNLDGSRVGKAVANQGIRPSVDVGRFDGAGDAYVLAY